MEEAATLPMEDSAQAATLPVEDSAPAEEAATLQVEDSAPAEEAEGYVSQEVLRLAIHCSCVSWSSCKASLFH